MILMKILIVLSFAGALGAVKRPDSKPTATRHDVFVEKLSAIPEIAECGTLFKSSQPVELTGNVWFFNFNKKFTDFSNFQILESETEYVVQCIKHIFPEHIVLQFDCTNTLNDQLLENVSIEMELEAGFELINILQVPR